MVAVLRGAGVPTQDDFHAAITARSDRWFSACLRILGDAAAAEDAVQEALMTAWNKRAQFNRESRLETWIHRIAVNAALQAIRKNKPRLYESLDVEPPSTDAGPADEQYRDELDDKLTTAMRHLSDIERACFVLKHIEEWRHSEIAEELDTTVEVSKQAVFRAVKKLRGEMTMLKDAIA